MPRNFSTFFLHSWMGERTCVGRFCMATACATSGVGDPAGLRPKN
jgi:hypothetical protein